MCTNEDAQLICQPNLIWTEIHSQMVAPLQDFKADQELPEVCSKVRANMSTRLVAELPLFDRAMNAQNWGFHWFPPATTEIHKLFCLTPWLHLQIWVMQIGASDNAQPRPFRLSGYETWVAETGVRITLFTFIHCSYLFHHSLFWVSNNYRFLTS